MLGFQKLFQLFDAFISICERNTISNIKELTPCWDFKNFSNIIMHLWVFVKEMPTLPKSYQNINKLVPLCWYFKNLFQLYNAIIGIHKILLLPESSKTLTTCYHHVLSSKTFLALWCFQRYFSKKFHVLCKCSNICPF